MYAWFRLSNAFIDVEMNDFYSIYLYKYVHIEFMWEILVYPDEFMRLKWFFVELSCGKWNAESWVMKTCKIGVFGLEQMWKNELKIELQNRFSWTEACFGQTEATLQFWKNQNLTYWFEPEGTSVRPKMKPRNMTLSVLNPDVFRSHWSWTQGIWGSLDWQRGFSVEPKVDPKHRKNVHFRCKTSCILCSYHT